MAAPAALAAVGFSFKPLLQASRKKAKASRWVAVCCSVKGECLSCTQVWSFLHLLVVCLFSGVTRFQLTLSTSFGATFCSFSLGYVIWRPPSSSASPPPPQLCPSRRIVGHYERLAQCGTLREDVHQKCVIQRLDRLQHAWKNYSNSMCLSHAQFKRCQQSSYAASPPLLTIGKQKWCNHEPGAMLTFLKH